MGTEATSEANEARPAGRAVGEVKVRTAWPGVDELILTEESAGAPEPRLAPVMVSKAGL